MRMKNQDRNRRPVSIEQLLIWAYHDQMVHQAQRGRSGLTPMSAAPLAAASKVWSETTPVVASKNQGFEAAEDAWRIHDLVLQLGAISVDCGQDLAAARYHGLSQYRGAEPPLGSVGTVDNTARPWPTNGVLSIDLRALVMIHANKATRPIVYREADIRFKPDAVVWHPKKRTGVFAKGWFCHCVAVGIMAGDVVQSERVFAAWRQALAQLLALLRPIPLTMFDVTDELPGHPQKARQSA
jgi:hypothetical protein